MNIDEIKQAVANKLSSLRSQRDIAFTNGHLSLVVSLDAEINETELTLARL